MDAFETLAKNKKSMIESMARRLLRGHGGAPTLDDLVQAGMIGLWKAHQQSSPERESTFEHYVQERVWGAMVDELRVLNHRSRLAHAAWTRDTWSTATPWAILVSSPVECAHDLHAPENPEVACQNVESATFIRRSLARLPRRHAYVIKRRYFEEADLATIGEELTVTEARASQLVGEGLLLLRESLTSREVDGLAGSQTSVQKVMKNRGAGRARVFTHKGKSQSLVAWSRELRVSVATLQNRLRSGWSMQNTLGTPVKPRKRN